MAVEQVSIRSYLLRRGFEAIPVVLAVIVINFTLVHLAPGDPVSIMVGQAGGVDPHYVEMMRTRFGLDKPLYEQLIIYLVRTLQGDLGYSFYYQRPVLNLILERIPTTLLLMLTQFIIASVLGVVLGVEASRKPYSKLDNATTTVALLGYSLPVFWVGQLLVLVFSIWLGFFPVQGMLSIQEDYRGVDYVVDILRHLTLPAVAMGLYNIALVFRLSKTSMLEVLWQDYITTARAKGIREKRVIYRHALRNALVPVVTVLGMNLGFILTGAVMTETVFAWPGLGRMMFDAIYARDYPVLMGMLIMVSVMVVVANLLTDLAYGYLDPRVRHR